MDPPSSRLLPGCPRPPFLHPKQLPPTCPSWTACHPGPLIGGHTSREACECTQAAWLPALPPSPPPQAPQFAFPVFLLTSSMARRPWGSALLTHRSSPKSGLFPPRQGQGRCGILRLRPPRPPQLSTHRRCQRSWCGTFNERALSWLKSAPCLTGPTVKAAIPALGLRSTHFLLLIG